MLGVMGALTGTTTTTAAPGPSGPGGPTPPGQQQQQQQQPQVTSTSGAGTTAGTGTVTQPNTFQGMMSMFGEGIASAITSVGNVFNPDQMASIAPQNTGATTGGNTGLIQQGGGLSQLSNPLLAIPTTGSTASNPFRGSLTPFAIVDGETPVPVGSDMVTITLAAPTTGSSSPATPITPTNAPPTNSGINNNGPSGPAPPGVPFNSLSSTPAPPGPTATPAPGASITPTPTTMPVTAPAVTSTVVPTPTATTIGAPGTGVTLPPPLSAVASNMTLNDTVVPVTPVSGVPPLVSNSATPPPTLPNITAPAIANPADAFTPITTSPSPGRNHPATSTSCQNGFSICNVVDPVLFGTSEPRAYCYDPASFRCVNDNFLCTINTPVVCGRTCYNPTFYLCVDGKLVER